MKADVFPHFFLNTTLSVSLGNTFVGSLGECLFLLSTKIVFSSIFSTAGLFINLKRRS